MRKLLGSVSVILSLGAMAMPAWADCGESDFGAYIRQIEGGAQGYSAVNPTSSATGAYQFLAPTLQSLGMISHLPSNRSSLFGNSSWEGVVWSDKARAMGINSRADFKANQAAQDQLFAEFTQRNLQTVSSSWTPGQVVNGVQLTPGGVAAATHMLGTGGFQQWAASGFSASGLSASIARAHNWTPEQYNQHLMRRVAQGGCMDPSSISISEGGGNHTIAELPEIFLMPFNARQGPAVLMPGQLVSLSF